MVAVCSKLHKLVEKDLKKRRESFLRLSNSVILNFILLSQTNSL